MGHSGICRGGWSIWRGDRHCREKGKESVYYNRPGEQGSGARGRTRAVVIKEGAAGRSKGQNQWDLVANCKWGVRYSQR